ncbi:MAG: hypothetical protein J6O03_07635 [Butyrivibrio sp.]|nr:hypothetical protein [Butyrivibrio sp.]MBP3825624.1 hypothetical protein [Butyrivibrio sp.]
MISDNLDNKLSKKNKDDEKRKISPPGDDEDEETYMYDIRKPMAFINEGEHGVFDITKQTGLNTAKSVFDKGSVFKTNL